MEGYILDIPVLVTLFEPLKRTNIFTNYCGLKNLAYLHYYII